VAGKGEIEDLETGEIHPISDGTLYEPIPLLI